MQSLPIAPYKGRSALVSAFGALDVADGKILSSMLVDGTRITGAAWERRHMVIVPSLPGVARRLYVNRAIVEPLTRALAACVALPISYGVRSIGCFAPRGKRGNPSSLSLHSYGLAVDINSDTNPMRAPIVRDIPDAWVAAFEAVGWTWGGRWRMPDPMHFQWASGV
jgi:hypothetical protein